MPQQGIVTMHVCAADRTCCIRANKSPGVRRGLN